MRYRELRRILQQIVIAGLPAIAGGCVEAIIDTDCIDTVERTFTVDSSADPSLQFDINSCRIDPDACIDLCIEVMKRNNINASMDNPPSECSVEFGESSVDINVSFEVSSGGSDCPVDQVFEARIDAAPEAAARELGSGTDLSSPALGLPDSPQVRGLYARAFDSIWNGGRTCHA